MSDDPNATPPAADPSTTDPAASAAPPAAPPAATRAPRRNRSTDTGLSDGQRTSLGLAEAQAEANDRRATDEHPGGRYMVGGQLVDAEGKPLKK